MVSFSEDIQSPCMMKFPVWACIAPGSHRHVSFIRSLADENRPSDWAYSNTNECCVLWSKIDFSLRLHMRVGTRNLLEEKIAGEMDTRCDIKSQKSSVLAKILVLRAEESSMRPERLLVCRFPLVVMYTVWPGWWYKAIGLRNFLDDDTICWTEQSSAFSL